MCRIKLETIEKANRLMMAKRIVPQQININRGIYVEAFSHGRFYRQTIPFVEIETAYKNAYNKVIYGSKI